MYFYAFIFLGLSGEMEDQVCDWSTVHKPVGDLYEHVNLVGTLVVCLGSSLSTCIIFHSNRKSDMFIINKIFTFNSLHARLFCMFFVVCYFKINFFTLSPRVSNSLGPGQHDEAHCSIFGPDHQILFLMIWASR